MSDSDDVRYEILSHYFYGLASEVQERGDKVPLGVSESLISLLHVARITHAQYARGDETEPIAYDRPYWTLSFAFVTDDEEVARQTAWHLTKTIGFLNPSEKPPPEPPFK